ncbi:GSCFA domain-containing protein [Sinomicrobium weinanense]|uniref:GSCFA domain-containing protein n=1 Tax=Sinomicrobium weinanense TaxID=2842200 RepID=A0A926Q2L6_9FLAO|nr:GSCFA domain-containing protein [Sinomicrobium weinanense]MBC9796658.1 GSCFA domain-containing protein [Sinomicrobium weinanense]MBU3124908.1 GSCFA domain-containing protein [Sinomicrobium weinanense]
MKLQTQIPVSPGKNRISYDSRLLLLGSCFVENMGSKLDYFKFPCLQNPFGILFHPGALENFTARVTARQKYTEEVVFEHNGRWHCFDAHSVMSGNSREAVLSRLNKALDHTADYLKNATHIVITLGTAWGYRLKDSGLLVANCHKVPQRQFVRELAPIEAIEKSIEGAIKHIGSVNPGVQFVFTVSPVRHVKDGFVENQRSKAHLITALHNVLKKEAYFPSYEIMMDELRDYRFYAEDMIHPNQTAIDYIWEKFTLAWISPEAVPVMEEVDAIQKGLAHKPFAPSSEQHQKFLKSLQERISRLQARVPHIWFE